MSGLITVNVPGTAETRINDGDYPRERPERWERWNTSRRSRRSGRGYTVTITLDREDWLDVADYLASVEGATAAAVKDNPDDYWLRNELRAVRTTLDRITEHISEVEQLRR